MEAGAAAEIVRRMRDQGFAVRIGATGGIACEPFARLSERQKSFLKGNRDTILDVLRTEGEGAIAAPPGRPNPAFTPGRRLPAPAVPMDATRAVPPQPPEERLPATTSPRAPP